MIDREVSPVSSQEPSRILIVEDEGIIGLRLERLLVNRGYEVVGPVTSGEAALRSVGERPPDLVLMDVHLAGEMDGIETAGRIRERLDVPIIYLTAYTERMVMEEVKHTQPYGFLAKPVRAEELCATVEMAIYKHRMEARLRESEKRYRLLAENVEDVIWQTNETIDRYTYVSSSAIKLLGYTSDEMMKIDFLAQLSPAFRPQIRAAIDHRLAAEAEGRGDDETRLWEVIYIRQDGSMVWVESTTRPLRDEDGTFRGLVGVTRDISARKQAEEKYRALIQNIQAGVVVHGADSRIIACNTKAREFLGFTEDQMIGKATVDSAWQFVREDGTPMPVDEYPFSQVLNTGQPVRGMVIGGIRPGESDVAWATVEADPILGPTGEIEEVIVSFMDITERKRARETLEGVRFSIDQVMDSVLWVDEWGNFIDVNDAACRNLGYTRQELLQMGVADVDPHYPREKWDAHWEEITQRGTMTIESVHQTKDGRRFPVEVVIHNQQFGDTRYNCVLVRDITGRKRMEEALQQSLIDLKLAQDIAEIGNWQFDPAIGIPVWSEQVYEIYERDPQLGPPHIDDYQRMYEADQFEIFNTAIQRAVQEGEPYDITLRLKLPSGVKWIHTICRPEDEKGPAGYFLRGTIQDITVRKEAAEALQAAQERLQILHEIDAAILAARSPEAIGQAALEHLYALIPYHRASVSEVDLVRQRAREVVVLQDGKPVEGMSVWQPLSKGGSIVEAARWGRTSLVQDLASWETFSPLEQYLKDIGGRGYVSVPIIIQDELSGMLNLSVDRPNFFRPEHVQVLEDIAASLTVAMQQAHLLEQTQEDAETKALLLREVNHRVLNNLTAIMAILDMEQRRSLEDGVDFRAVLRDVISRVEGMITIHRMLSSVQWAPLDLSQVIERVIYAALGSSPIRSQVEVIVDGPDEPLRVPSRQAIALALVINELTTNSVKYAFQDRVQGRIDVEITPLDERRVRVSFRDDGIGIPTEVLAGDERNVGLGLVEANVRHTLGGEIDFHNDDGAVVTFTFECASPD